MWVTLSTTVLYVDFEKAFDIVNHQLLIGKLKVMKKENIALKWINSDLSNRVQCTQIGSVISNEKDVKTGVPQGSILGPLFFLCYINYITQICTKTKILLYADDTQILIRESGINI